MPFIPDNHFNNFIAAHEAANAAWAEAQANAAAEAAAVTTGNAATKAAIQGHLAAMLPAVAGNPDAAGHLAAAEGLVATIV